MQFNSVVADNYYIITLNPNNMNSNNIEII